MRSVLDYVIRIMKEGKGDRETIDALKSLKTNIGNVMGVLGGLTAAYAFSDRVIGESVRSYVTLTDRVRDFRNMTGMTAEDSSRLIEVFGDLGISQDKVTTAFKYAEKNGMQPSIESLMKMQQEYQNLEKGQERVAFLQEQFGKSGLDLQVFFETGDIASRLASVSDSMVISDSAIDSVLEYKEAVNDLKDTWESAKLTLGEKVVPVLTDVVRFLNNGQKEVDKSGASWMRYVPVLQQVYAAYTLIAAIKDTTTPKAEEIDSATRSYQAMAMAAQAQAKADADAALQAQISTEAAMANYTSLLGFSDKYVDNQQKIQEKEAEIAAARKEDLPRLKAELADLQMQQEKFMNQFMLQMLQLSGVGPDTLIAIARGMGLITSEAYNAYIQTQKLAAEVEAIPESQKKQFEYYVRVTGDVSKALALLRLTGGSLSFNSGVNTVNIDEQATGGPLAPIAKVGEAGYEYVINGVVIPHDAAVWLERAGILGTAMAAGGFIMDQAIGSQVASSTNSVKRMVGVSTTVSTYGSTSAADKSTAQLTPVAMAQEVATATAQTIAPVQATLANATAATINQGNTMANTMQQIGNDQVNASAGIVAAINSLPNRISDIMVDAVRQVLQYGGGG